MLVVTHYCNRGNFRVWYFVVCLKLRNATKHTKTMLMYQCMWHHPRCTKIYSLPKFAKRLSAEILRVQKFLQLQYRNFSAPKICKIAVLWEQHLDGKDHKDCMPASVNAKMKSTLPDLLLPTFHHTEYLWICMSRRKIPKLIHTRCAHASMKLAVRQIWYFIHCVCLAPVLFHVLDFFFFNLLLSSCFVVQGSGGSFRFQRDFPTLGGDEDRGRREHEEQRHYSAGLPLRPHGKKLKKFWWRWCGVYPFTAVAWQKHVQCPYMSCDLKGEVTLWTVIWTVKNRVIPIVWTISTDSCVWCVKWAWQILTYIYVHGCMVLQFSLKLTVRSYLLANKERVWTNCSSLHKS